MTSFSNYRFHVDSLVAVGAERRQLMALRQAKTLGDLKPKLIDSARGYYERAKERAFRKCPLPDSRIVRMANLDTTTAIQSFRPIMTLLDSLARREVA